jgi:hypothetical protein
LRQNAQGVSRAQFGLTGVEAVLADAPADAVGHLMAAVMRHAATENLSDDATAVFVTWQ